MPPKSIFSDVRFFTPEQISFQHAASARLAETEAFEAAIEWTKANTSLEYRIADRRPAFLRDMRVAGLNGNTGIEYLSGVNKRPTVTPHIQKCLDDPI